MQENPDSAFHRVVSGFQRLLALKNLEYKQVSAQIYTAGEKTDFELFQAHLSENASFRNFNDVERANIIDKLVNQFQLPELEVSRNYLPLIGLGTNPKVIRRYLPLVLLPDYIKEALATEVIGVEMASEIGRLSEVDQTFFFDLCLTLKLGKNRQKEFLHLFQDISGMFDDTLSGVANKIQLKKILSDDSVPTPVRTERVRMSLKRLRYPQLTEVEENFQQILKKFKLPPKMVLTPFPFFEEAQFTIKFDFQDRAELEKKIAALTQIAQNPAMEDLKNLT